LTHTIQVATDSYIKWPVCVSFSCNMYYARVVTIDVLELW